jgi:hypothetical protein
VSTREIVMKRLMTLALMWLVVGVGCSSSTSSKSDVDAWEREVRIYEPGQVPNRQYEELGGLLEVREPLNGNFGTEEQAIDTAKRKLRREAAERDADAVVIVECGRHVRPDEDTRVPQIGPEVVCHGVAIRWITH